MQAASILMDRASSTRRTTRRVLALLAFLPTLALIGSANAAPTPCPATAVRIAAGTNIAKVVRARPAGTSFCLAAGEYRMQSIVPKQGQAFYGEGKARLNGSHLVTNFTREGALWVAGGQTQHGYRTQHENCLPKAPRCDFPEVFYINDKPLKSVGTKGDVKPGTFFLNYGNHKVYIADDPAGKTVEGSVKPYAFLGGATDVTIDGLIVEKYSSPIQFAAVGYNMPSAGWLVQNSEIRLNHGLGVNVATDGKLLKNYIHSNGEMGIGCSGDDVLIEGNEIAYNGFFTGLDPAWEGGGGKCVLTNRLTFRNNYSHDNNSYGFWTDIDNIHTLYEGNRVEDNADGGISHEISYAATIRNNTFKGNGYAFDVWLWGSAINVQNSREVEVYGNTVEITHAGNGISLIQQNRGSGKHGPHKTINNYIHDNVTISRRPDVGAWGAIADYDSAGMKAGNNRFEHNTYEVTSKSGGHWAWVDDFFDWATYRKKSGQDATSSVVILK